MQNLKTIGVFWASFFCILDRTVRPAKSKKYGDFLLRLFAFPERYVPSKKIKVKSAKRFWTWDFLTSKKSKVSELFRPPKSQFRKSLFLSFKHDILNGYASFCHASTLSYFTFCAPNQLHYLSILLPGKLVS